MSCPYAHMVRNPGRDPKRSAGDGWSEVQSARYTDELLERARKVGDAVSDRLFAAMVNAGVEYHSADVDLLDVVCYAAGKEYHGYLSSPPPPLVNADVEPQGDEWRGDRIGWGSAPSHPDVIREAALLMKEVSGAAVEWVDREKAERGKRLFLGSGPSTMFVLTCACLPLSYGAGAGVQVLSDTGRLRDDAVARIFETGVFLADVMGDGGLEPGAKGWKAVLKVRLLHSAIRHFLSTRGSGWDESVFGIPINQEDMAGTLCVFGPIFVEGVRALGYTVTPEEEAAYFHRWQWVAHILGITPIVMPRSYEECAEMAHVIRARQWTPSSESVTLTDALFGSLHMRLDYFFLPESFWREMSAYLIEPMMAEKLEVRPQGGLSGLFVWGVRTATSLLSWVHHTLPTTREIYCAVNYRVWLHWNALMSSAGRSVDFKIRGY